MEYLKIKMEKNIQIMKDICLGVVKIFQEELNMN